MIDIENIKPNQKIIDEAQKAREIILKKLIEVSTKYPDGFVSTQQLANILYPEGPFHSGPYHSSTNNKINVKGDLLLSRLKKLKKQGLVEVRKMDGKCFWKHID